MNKKHMEQWIAALETYDEEPARHTLIDERGRMCAMGIGLNTMLDGKLLRAVNVLRPQAINFPLWIGIHHSFDDPFNLPLKSDGSGCDTVTAANDVGRQSPWTIAQRLRETYLKEEQ
jgi:hypothetical protein